MGSVPERRSDEPARSFEVEAKFDVDADTPLPDLSGLPGVARIGAPEPRDLDARYLDTADFALGARAMPCVAAPAAPTPAGTSRARPRTARASSCTGR